MPNLFWHYNPPPCKHTKSSLGHKFQVDLARYSLGQSCGRFTWAQSSASSNPKSRPSLSLSLSRITAAFQAQVRCGAVRCGRTDKTDSLLNSLQTWMLSCTTLPPPVFVSSSWTCFVEDLMRLAGGFWRRRCVSGLSSLFFELVNE